jgi:hypothetical protein
MKDDPVQPTGAFRASRNSRRRGCVIMVLIYLSLGWSTFSLSQEVVEGEFSGTVLGYKLQLLKAQFGHTGMSLLTRGVAGTTFNKLEHVYSEIKGLEAEFRWGRYYPDLLDERIVLIREELRLAESATTCMSKPGLIGDSRIARR